MCHLYRSANPRLRAHRPTLSKVWGDTWMVKRIWHNWNSLSLLGEMGGILTTLEDSLSASYKYSPTDHCSNYTVCYSPDVEMLWLHKNTASRCLHPAFFMTPKAWKQLRCPSMNGWIHCGISTQQTIYLIRRIKETLSHGKTWSELTCVSLSEIANL